ncbi:MAG: DMT family transporter, partial [Pseudomonadota bacterium]
MTLQARPIDRPTLAILCAVLGALAFSLNDSLVKLLSAGYALPQIIFFRSSIAFLIVVFLIVSWDVGLRALWSRKWGLLVLRGSFVVAANISFFTGIAAMPLADGTALFFVAPLLITVLSVFVLRERVGPRRLLAVVVGLIGVLIIMRPGIGVFQFAALLPIIAACFYASLHMLTRILGSTESASVMAAYIQATVMVFMGLLGVLFGDGRFAETDNPSLAKQHAKQSHEHHHRRLNICG